MWSRAATRVAAMVLATVRFWRDDEGWGVLDSPETPGGCWASFAFIEMPGYRKLSNGQTVELEWEVPAGVDYEGWPYFASRVTP
jgi:cold shock protein